MKIGILLSAYNSEDYIDECLKPWFNLKSEFDITIGCNSGMYKEYIDFGFEPKNKPTLQKLCNYDLDFLITTGQKSLLGENDSKNSVLHVLKNSCDLVWILDSDEFYTESEIRNILNYINQTPQYDWYSVNFKNYTFTNKLFIDGFHPPRIFRTDRNEGINEFYFDNHIKYNDGENFDTKPNSVIPREVAWVKHLTWLNNDTRSIEKIPYQNNRFVNGCSFQWDECKKSLRFSEEFYDKVGIEMPVLHEVIDMFSDEFTITFNRTENKFYVDNIRNTKPFTFKIYDPRTGDLIYETELNLTVGLIYFIWPSSVRFYDIKNFKKFRIEVIFDRKVIHHEFLHIRYE